MNFLSSDTDRSSQHSTKLWGRDTPQTQMTNDMEISISLSPKECRQFPSNTILLDHFTKIFLHLRRAAVRYIFLLKIFFLLNTALQNLLLFTCKRILRHFKNFFEGEKAMISHLLQDVQYSVSNVRGITYSNLSQSNI